MVYNGPHSLFVTQTHWHYARKPFLGVEQAGVVLLVPENAYVLPLILLMDAIGSVEFTVSSSACCGITH